MATRRDEAEYPKPKDPEASFGVTLTADERRVVHHIGYFAILQRAFENVDVFDTGEPTVEEAIAHLRMVILLFDQIGWREDDERVAFDLDLPWTFLVETLGAVERDLARSLSRAVKDLRFDYRMFGMEEDADTARETLRELEIVARLIRRVGGRWREEGEPAAAGAKREYDFGQTDADAHGETLGVIFDRIRSSRPLLPLYEVRATAFREWWEDLNEQRDHIEEQTTEEREVA